MTASQDVQDSFDESLKLNSSNSPPSGGLKRQVGNVDAFPAPKRICPQFVTDPPSNCDIPKFTGFLTAGSNREIKVSEAALSSARARLHASDEDVDEGGAASARSDVGKGSNFVGFVTAGTNKPITVSDSALEMAKRRLDNSLGGVSASPRGAADSENRDPSQLHVPSPSPSLMRRSSNGTRSFHHVPKQTDFKSPLLRKTPRVARISRSPRDSPLCSPLAVEKSIGGAWPMPSNPPGTLTPSGRNVLATGKVVAEFPKAFRATCIRDLRSCPQDTVDFLGIVVGSGAHGQNRSNVPVIKMADRYGESVQVELLSSSIPVNISIGSVISIEGAVIRRNEGAISLILDDSAFVDLEPNDPEAECLHRLFRTGLFDIAPSEDDFTFENTALRVIGRLSEYPNDVSTVMARICSINYEALVYLGCITCKRYAVRGPDGVESCQNCNSKKARYFYSLHVEVADFSGVLAVYFTDEAAEKLIGKPAGGMVKLHKDLLRTKLSPLCYRPMLFRISFQNSKWLIDDWKHLEIPRFKPFLLNIAKQKGYK
ncbi:hypothetical protein V3C99_002026 [Haemonchus contortus]